MAKIKYLPFPEFWETMLQTVYKDKTITGLSVVVNKPASGDKLYTAFDVIRLVQEAVSEEICGLGDEGMVVAYEVERGIVAELVKEEAK